MVKKQLMLSKIWPTTHSTRTTPVLSIRITAVEVVQTNDYKPITIATVSQWRLVCVFYNN